MRPENTSDVSTLELTADACSRLGFSLSQEQITSLAAYLDLLVKWNKVMNLVGRATRQDILEHLVIDSLHLAEFLPPLGLPEKPECWDLGSGAGLPGVPLRLLWQRGCYFLVESREKRALFLRTALASCPLPGVSVFQGRAEAFMPSRPPADLVVSRAFMPWEKVLDMVGTYTAPMAVCIFLTLTPLPGTLPEGWTAVAEKRYMVGRDFRFFWAIRRD